MIGGNQGQADKVCSRCGRHFKAAAKARYCSKACKQAAYRDRKARQEAESVTL